MTKLTLPALRPRPLLGLVLVCLLVAGSAGAYAIGKASRDQDPEVLWPALETLLTTEGVTCTIKDETDGRSSSQAVSLDLEQQHRATSRTTITEDGVTVVTEGITTKSDEYIRYVDIRTDKQTADGQPLDFSSIVETWGKQKIDSTRPSSLYGQTALGGCIAPMANLPSDKSELLARLQTDKIFSTPNSVEWGEFEGRQLRKYDITVQAAPYIYYMKRLATARGLKDLDSVTAEQFAGRQPEKLVFMVDPEVRQLVAITYPARDRTITFSDYGKVPKIKAPKTTISTAELQQKLAAVE